MASYSTTANVQNLVYGNINSDLDTATSNYRDIATSIINAKLGLKTDLTVVPDVVTRCCSLLAAGFLSSGPDDDIENNGYYKAGMLLLEAMGEEVAEGSHYNSIPIEGFGRYSDFNHAPELNLW